jgi:hypothetical protein
MMYAFFWVIPQRLNFVFRRFGTLCSIFIGRWLCEERIRFFTQQPAYKDGTECSATSAHKIQMTRNNPEESKQNLEHGESFKSRKIE